ncbi:chemotaxis protein CheB [Cystobacter fuscus]
MPKDFPAAVLVVLHLSAGHRSFLPEILARGPLPALHPQPETPLEPGRIYVAPSDRHLLVEPGRALVNSGPRENGHRPAVDPLFRSAARAYGPRVIGVVLTGALDCGTSGLIAIKAQGGLAIVQDPEDAYCPDMPRSALEYVKVDHQVKLADLGALLVRLVSAPLPHTRSPNPHPAWKRRSRPCERYVVFIRIPGTREAPRSSPVRTVAGCSSRWMRRGCCATAAAWATASPPRRSR